MTQMLELFDKYFKTIFIKMSQWGNHEHIWKMKTKENKFHSWVFILDTIARTRVICNKCKKVHKCPNGWMVKQNVVHQ